MTMGILVGTLAMWQGMDLSGKDLHLLMIFTGVAAVMLAFQALVIIAVAIVGYKTQKDLLAFATEMKSKSMPLIGKAEVLIAQASATTADLTPTIKNITTKIDAIAANVEHLSGLVKDKVAEFGPTISAANVTVVEANETVREANRKTQEQIIRVNGMVTSVLDTVAEAGQSIRRGISIPQREAAGLVNGVKAAFSSFLSRPKTRYTPPAETPHYRRLITTYHSMGDVSNPRTPHVPDEGTATEGVEHIYATDADLGL